MYITINPVLDAERYASEKDCTYCALCGEKITVSWWDEPICDLCRQDEEEK